MKNLKPLILILTVILSGYNLSAQRTSLPQEAEKAMLKATRYMVEKVSTNGGYVWHYLPDLSRRWGEMEAYKTMIWVQSRAQ
jgi:hypothetical protein